MTGRLAFGLALAMLAAACSTAPTSPTAAPPAPAATWDPRRDEIDQAQGVWTAEQPATYAYTSTSASGGAGPAISRVTAIDGHVEVQPQVRSSTGSEALTVDELFDAARAGLGGSGSVTVAVDQQYGFLSSVESGADGAADGFRAAITGFTTPSARTTDARASEALTQLLSRWRSVVTPDWEYTWSRIDATSAGTPTGWVVRHADGRTIAVAAGSSEEVPPPDEVTIDGIVGDATGVMVSGGWVDVASDDLTGLDVLIAIDPNPATKGDGYWIRIDYTDRAAASQKERLEAARTRWAAAEVRKATYTWAYDGDKGAWSWKVRASDDTVKVLKHSAGAPAIDAAFVRPGIADAFTLIESIIDAGGTVSVTYDKVRGYPTRIVIGRGGSAAPKGTITITKLKTP